MRFTNAGEPNRSSITDAVNTNREKKKLGKREKKKGGGGVRRNN